MSEEKDERTPPVDEAEDLTRPEDLPAAETGIDPEVLKGLPPALKKVLCRRVEATNGIMPPPSMLKEYAEIMPDCPERMLAMWEGQAAHRQRVQLKTIELEELYLQGSLNDSKRGQIFGFIICMTLVLGGVFVAWLGHPWPGLCSSVVGMGSLVYAFRKGLGYSAREAAQDAAAEAEKESEE